MAPTRRRGLPHDTIPFSVIREQWMKKPGFKEAYDALEEEFNLVDALYQAQVQSALTETELAEKMGIPLSALRRLMGGRSNPSFKTLCRFAAATGTKVRIRFEPVAKEASPKKPKARKVRKP